ncbi:MULTISPECIES: hypothetical protein [Salegentibacter]|uniref:Uncharacterized protein n=1 Tax=Salegentibacter mishustinae TaxID=270918 RepID=A0A0Q9ZAA8_9FLAO|nr:MULTISPECIES: hypothetical protein [Salegentibacter]HKL35525.1 hypothetical protein [Salegentibacter sp.]KRG29935.1 hypothetical protein APR42_14285 [Salegentibacter mishustinae]MBO2543496.1 hypothetical protein [Salegentibacter sp. BDJ18]PNW20656.1 hypothetical protein APB85_05050 [Salegentibacter mishustinae]PZX61667.1 hypothetical protein LY54_03027 [Salegentibacter mishustinae]
MSLPQEHLPKDRDATSEQEWGFTIWEFIADNWLYLMGILLILAIFLYARYNWRRRQQKSRMN